MFISFDWEIGYLFMFVLYISFGFWIRAVGYLQLGICNAFSSYMQAKFAIVRKEFRIECFGNFDGFLWS